MVRVYSSFIHSFIHSVKQLSDRTADITQCRKPYVYTPNEHLFWTRRRRNVSHRPMCLLTMPYMFHCLISSWWTSQYSGNCPKLQQINTAQLSEHLANTWIDTQQKKNKAENKDKDFATEWWERKGRESSGSNINWCRNHQSNTDSTVTRRHCTVLNWRT